MSHSQFRRGASGGPRGMPRRPLGHNVYLGGVLREPARQISTGWPHVWRMPHVPLRWLAKVSRACAKYWKPRSS